MNDDLEEVTYLKRKRGTVLLLDGRQYYKQREYKSGNIIWICSQSKKIKCHGSVTLKGNHIVKRTIHSCKADYGRNEVDMVIGTIKEHARRTDIPIPQIYAKNVSSLKNKGIDLVTPIPQMKSVKTSLYASRSKTHFTDPKDVTVPLQFCENPRFLLADYYYQGCRIIVFCSDDGRLLLKSIEEYFMDGTFQSCPAPFQQLFNIHGDMGGSSSAETNVRPLVYVRMSNKNQISYTALFEMIKSQVPEWKPKKVHFDFETAVANALVDVFPDVELKKCYARFSKSSWKKAKDIKIKSKTERRIVSLCAALALLPKTQIDDGVAYIYSELPKTQKNTIFMQYIQRTWLKNDVFNSQWCVYDERHRTNNVVESWHSQLNKDMNKRCPVSILRLLNVLMERETFGKNESSERRQQYIGHDDFIMSCQPQLIHGEISLGHFLEKLR